MGFNIYLRKKIEFAALFLAINKESMCMSMKLLLGSSITMEPI